MKVLASSILLLLSAVSSYETNDMTAARVIINGLEGDLTPEDVQLVHDTIADLSTPSVPYPQPALRANSVSVESDKEEPMINGGVENIMMWWRRQPAPAPTRKSCGGWGCGGWDPNNPNHQRGRWYGYNHDYSCGPLCHNDDKFLIDAVIPSALIVSKITSTEADSAKEAQVCETLRNKGSPALAHATTCTITPMLASPSVASLCVDGAKAGEALVFVDGAVMNSGPDNADGTSSLTDEEAEVLETSVTDAYNEAYQEAGLVLESFQALNMAVPPVPDTEDTSSDDASSTVIMGEFRQLCTDVDIHDKANDLDRMHQVFEEMLCEKLRDSGLSIFHSVKACAYRTFQSRASTIVNQVSSSVSEE